MSAQGVGFDINESTYDWCVRAFHIIHDTLGLNIKVHGDTEATRHGDIFIFNHFARFETVIPPYIIHRATGAYCRSVADHALFEGNERLASFLRSVGATPNDIPGLLPFLAAEILRGRKVIFFPEGGMVKDRRVMDDAGQYNIYSRTAQERRKHHKGAAILALTLDIFKWRIRSVNERGDEKRIARWVKALHLPSAEVLLSAVAKPTLVVPGTITFYPLRINENAVSRSAELLSKGLRKQFLEELVVEGNLLFKNTDMDIRFTEPLSSQKKWRWWERKLLERYFAKISSLEELFDLREQKTQDWADKILAKCIARETNRIRDLSMKALYTGITVNLSHLASYLIYHLVNRSHMSIDVETFNKTLYLALKNLQASTHVSLHRSLYWPDRYRGLIEGQCAELDRFLATAKTAGLVDRNEKSYHFLSPLLENFTFDEVRLANPVLVYANEVAPLQVVRATVDKAFIDAPHVSEQDIASYLFDDELRAHDWNKRNYQAPQYAEINARETATQDGAPYLLLAKKQNRIGVLLVHGLLATPAEWQNYAQHLCARGQAVMGIRLAGHGTSPWDLHERKWSDWRDSIARGYRILSAFCERIVMIGFSTGGALSLLYAAQWPQHLYGVAAINTPIEFRNRKMAYVPLIHGLNKLANWLPMIDDVIPFRENNSEHPLINYRSVPIPALYEMRALIEELQNRLPKVQAPVLLIQSDDDPIVQPDSVKHIHGKLACPSELKWVSSARHGIVSDDDDHVWSLLDNFIASAARSQPEGGT